MNLILFTFGLVALFLVGTFVLSIYCRIRFDDESAAYKLFAVRDKAIALVAIEGFDRDDPWVDYLYRSTNEVLSASHLLSGPENWGFASMVGTSLGEKDQQHVPTEPSSAPHSRIVELLAEADQAMLYLSKHHVGIKTFFNSKKRAQRRKEMARAKAIQARVHAVSRAHSGRLLATA